MVVKRQEADGWFPSHIVVWYNKKILVKKIEDKRIRIDSLWINCFPLKKKNIFEF